VTLRFNVPRFTFKEKPLARLLALVAFHESPTPILSDAPRLRLIDYPGFQEVTITGHGLDEFQTPAFDDFLAQAVAAHARRDAHARPAAKLKRAADL
jgi:excinuclease ABC subunit A